MAQAPAPINTGVNYWQRSQGRAALHTPTTTRLAHCLGGLEASNATVTAT
jgi:hypothetical protein